MTEVATSEPTTNTAPPVEPPAQPVAAEPNPSPAEPTPAPPAQPSAEPAPEESAPAEPQAVAEWRAGIADADLKKQAERYNSVEDILQHNKSLRQKLSTALVLPGKDASDEDLKEFRGKLGVPESPDGYDYEPPKDVPDFVKERFARGNLKEMFEVAHELGLSQEQIRGIMDYDALRSAEAASSHVKEREAYRSKVDGDLRREWGQDYEANMNLAKRAIDTFGADIHDWMAKTPLDGGTLATHPNMVRFAASVGRRMAEANLHLEHDAATMQSNSDKHSDLTNRIHEARASGNHDLASRLDKERAELSRNTWGSAEIVGRGSRVA